MRSKATLLLGLVLTALAVWAQEYSLRRYGLSLDIAERIWVQLAAGWAFLGAGLTARRYRPDSRTGIWMMGFGLIWIGSLVFTPPLIQWHLIGWAVALYGILFVILYTYPTGNLHGWERPAAWAWIGVVGVVAAAGVSLVDFYGWVDDSMCCPTHLLFVREDPALQETLFTWGLILATAVFTAVVVAQARRWYRSTPAGRRSLNTLAAVVFPLMTLLVLVPLVNAFRVGLAGLLPEASGGGLSPSPLPDRVNLYVQNGALVLLPAVMLAGLLATRLSRARVGDMVHDLGSTLPPDELESRLRQALGDPSARLAFPTEQGYVGVDGRPLADMGPDGGRLITEIGARVAIDHDAGLDADLVVAAGTAASLAIDNARLQAELRAQLREVQESRRRLIAATDEARRGVERDLHDGAQQRLVSLSAALRKALDASPQGDPDVEDLLRAAAGEADLAIAELRELARGVHPAILTQAGLGPAVAGLVDRAPIPVALSIEGTRQGAEVEATAYFVIAESLANVFKHSRASEGRVEVKTEAGVLVVEVEDDGEGGVDPSGSGLRGLADRVGALGGRLEAGTGGMGGSLITAHIPVGGKA